MGQFKMFKTGTYVATGLAIVLFGLLGIFAVNRDKIGPIPVPFLKPEVVLSVEKLQIQVSPHIRDINITAYSTNPPTSGPHLDLGMEWGSYARPVFDEYAVQNLEDGGIWISYLPDLELPKVAKLKRLAGKFPRAVLLSPRPANDAPIVIASWGQLMRLDEVNIDQIETFVRSFVNQSPEHDASLTLPDESAKVNVTVGNPFPDFEIFDLDGNAINNQSVAGKSTIIWFTTGWCVPCQIGAIKVADLDRSLGVTAFNVVVVFLDQDEDARDLLAWREQFANEDWALVLDDTENSLSDALDVKILDSKYLLDANGILTDIDVNIADEAYLEVLKTSVSSN
jgi:thiol-disulfide isomerase/thioredoxin